MSFILTLIGTMVVLDVLCAWWSLSILPSHALRWCVGIFIALQLAGLLAIVAGRINETDFDRVLPKFFVSSVFIWHFLTLGLLLCIAMVTLPVLGVRFIARKFQHHERITASIRRDGWTRREFLRAAAATAPPLFTIGLTTIALTQLSNFRVRRFVLAIPGLPPELENVTIAHVSDMHVGRFTSGRVLEKMVAAVNDLRADLVLLTGDLINDALVDLADGIALVRQMQARHGMFLIEGNHDLIENASEFENRMRASGIPFLLDESVIVDLRGVAVQLLGLSWTRTHGQGRDAAISAAVRRLLQQRDDRAFPILLAHHPHAFDAAAEANLPLTLSGHTHGGQLMLNEQVGFGPALFRYWSGRYTRGASQLIVSNGVGNWYPLRVHAPAELVHITLQRG
ncbi:MAG: uncharacterized protein QOG48_2446 [Verrucomicrobiota bacterium]|jgi:predicted MPP superfamily phosphohydrolase